VPFGAFFEEVTERPLTTNLTKEEEGGREKEGRRRNKE
jgi:hypothetical protein